MAANPLIFKDAEKARDSILDSQKKEIADLYEKWANEIGEKAKQLSHKTTSSSALAERQMKELQKQIYATSKQVSNEVYSKIKKNLYMVADSVVESNAEWLSSFGFSDKGINIAFSGVADDTVRNLITGQIYDNGWNLSSKIWGDNEDTKKDIYQVMAKGLTENKPIYEIAKDLESYVRPSARLPWNFRSADGKKIFKKQVDYNAQRLARTLVQHGYQQSFLATTQKNPFITDYIWRSNGSRVCPLCLSRDGKHFKKDELPMDHPNGMCTMEPNVADDMNDQLANWFNNSDGTYPEIDKFAGNFGYKANAINTAEDFIKKYGTSTKSPSAWFNGMTPIQKSEAKALKEQSGLTWEKWYEKNILESKIEFTSLQTKYLAKYGYSVDNMPGTFSDWSHNLSPDDKKELFSLLNLHGKDHPFQLMEEWYDNELSVLNKIKAKPKVPKTKKMSELASELGDVFSDDVFSQIRKDNAYWFKNPEDADKVLRKVAGDNWINLTKTERLGLYEYTRGSGFMNRPLRGYQGSWSKSSFKGIGKANLNYERSDGEKLINAMTKAISNSKYDFDIWLQRGVSHEGTAPFLNVSESFINNATQKQLEEKLLGKVVTDEAFLSASAAKGKGFPGNIFNVYAPKGTKMHYAEPFSYFGNGDKLKWDGKKKQDYFSYEFETIIQRGTSYRITKVEKSGSKLYVDMEVVAQKF